MTVDMSVAEQINRYSRCFRFNSEGTSDWSGWENSDSDYMVNLDLEGGRIESTTWSSGQTVDTCATCRIDATLEQHLASALGIVTQQKMHLRIQHGVMRQALARCRGSTSAGSWDPLFA
jgi:hypothetical protein